MFHHEVLSDEARAICSESVVPANRVWMMKDCEGIWQISEALP